MLEIIVCHSQPERMRTSLHFIDEVMEKLNIPEEEYIVTQRSEQNLDIPSSFPQHAIVYVHGNFYDKYKNLGKARTLAQGRPDLKIIINVDGSKLREEHFQDQRDREYITTLLEQGFDSQQQVVVSTHVAPEFFSPNNKTNESFKYYLQQLRRRK
jgi:hypothetical protein